MGYCIYLMDAAVHIGKEKFAPALEAVKSAFPKYGDIQSSTQLGDAMSDFGYAPEFDGSGDICGLCYDGEKLREDFLLWSALAPFMNEGDYIEMEGEDFSRWRWIVKNGRCREIAPEIVWKDE